MYWAVMKVYYAVCSKHESSETIRSMYGWTDNEYMIQTYMEQVKDSEWGDNLEVYMYECSYNDFLGILYDEYDVDITMIKRFKLRITTTASGRQVISTQEEFDEIMSDTTVVHDMICAMLEAFIKLGILRQYIREDKVGIFLEFMKRKYFYDMVKILYNEGDCYNCKFDIVYLLLTEGWVSEA